MSDDESPLSYQSFSASYQLESAFDSLCTCDYCLKLNPVLGDELKAKLSKCMKIFQRSPPKTSPIVCPNSGLPYQRNDCLRAKSMEEIDNRNSMQESSSKKQQSQSTTESSSYFNLYDLWQGEKFKAKAFEKDNEKLEEQVRCLEYKLDKETHQQIRISLEWRKTVMNLVDENRKLRLQIQSLTDQS